MISRHLPPSTVTAKGHMIRTRKRLRSTKTDENEDDARAAEEDMAPDKQAWLAQQKTMQCSATVSPQTMMVIPFHTS